MYSYHVVTLQISVDEVSPPQSSDDEEAADQSLRKRLRLLERAREIKKNKRRRALVSDIITMYTM